MAEHEREGVIKYDLDFTRRNLTRHERHAAVSLQGWRDSLHKLGLIGEDPERYGGLGYGNISARVWLDADRFVITGTQTSGLPILHPAQHYAAVDMHDPETHTITAHGRIQPSSEAPTHAALYDVSLGITAVFHAHSPVIWRAAEQLGIPSTSPEVPYGTPEMAAEVGRLLEDKEVRQVGIIAMLGHEDGVITFGTSPDDAGERMLQYLDLAFEHSTD